MWGKKSFSLICQYISCCIFVSMILNPLILQDFLIVVDEDTDLNNITGELTLQNILNNMNNDLPNIVFDPNSLVFGLTEDISEDEAEILNTIKDEINSAVEKVAVDCGGRLCIQSVLSGNTTINAVNITQLLEDQSTTQEQATTQRPPEEPSRVVIIEPKNKVQARLSSCLTAIQCREAVSCMFAQVKMPSRTFCEFKKKSAKEILWERADP